MIEQFFFWIFILFGSAYVFIHFTLWKGLTGLSRPKVSGTTHSISVILAARNEEKNIAAVLQSLVEQNYPSDQFEILVVNDRSIDSTLSIIETFAKEHNNIRLIKIESNTSDMPNKKNALRSAIGQSKFEILSFTDADCIVPKNWLREIAQNFSDDVGVVAGYSPYASPKPHSFLRYEEYKNSLIAASAIELQHAFMCTGRNFSYRKKVYREVGGFEKIKHSVSGDDDLFVQLMQRETAWNIRYMISPESYVRTLQPVSFSQFVNQRTRHVSASRFYPRTIQMLYSFIHMFHLFIAIGFVFVPFFSLTALIIKFNIDGAFIANGKNIFHEEFTLAEFVMDETLLVLYSFLIAPLGLVMKFDWKGTHTN